MMQMGAIGLRALLLAGGAVIGAAPAWAQPIIIPLSPQAKDAPKPPPTPVPVAPPQADVAPQRGAAGAAIRGDKPPQGDTSQPARGGQDENTDRE